MQQAGEAEVVGVVAGALDEARVFLALETLTDPLSIGLVSFAVRFSVGGHGSPRAGGHPLGSLAGRIFHSVHDVLVAGAATQITAERFAYFAFRRSARTLQKIVGAHDHAGRAVSALQAVFFPEAFLKRVEIVFGCEAFNRGHGALVGLNRKHRARLYRFAVEQHSAGAADGSFATDVSAGQAGDIAQKMHEQQTRLDLGAVLNTVNFYGDIFLHRDPAVRLEFIGRDLRGAKR